MFLAQFPQDAVPSHHALCQLHLSGWSCLSSLASSVSSVFSSPCRSTSSEKARETTACGSRFNRFPRYLCRSPRGLSSARPAQTFPQLPSFFLLRAAAGRMRPTLVFRTEEGEAFWDVVTCVRTCGNHHHHHDVFLSSLDWQRGKVQLPLLAGEC